ncbi:hypothetical protein Tco_0146244 [Tanacetum coccineum]
MAVIEGLWFQTMQMTIHEFDRLEVWELVPSPNLCYGLSLSSGHLQVKYGCQNAFLNGDLQMKSLSSKLMVIHPLVDRFKTGFMRISWDSSDQTRFRGNGWIPELSNVFFRYLKGTLMGMWYRKDNAMCTQQLYAAADNAEVKDSEEVHRKAEYIAMSDVVLKSLYAIHAQRLRTLVFLAKNTMAEQNVPAQPPTRTDEQIVPRSQWLTIGKSNLLFNAQKIQKNPIFQISPPQLRGQPDNTNFFQCLHCLSKCPSYLPSQHSGNDHITRRRGL